MGLGPEYGEGGPRKEKSDNPEEKTSRFGKKASGKISAPSLERPLSRLPQGPAQPGPFERQLRGEGKGALRKKRERRRGVKGGVWIRKRFLCVEKRDRKRKERNQEEIIEPSAEKRN